MRTNCSRSAGTYQLALDASTFGLAAGAYYLHLFNGNAAVESKVVLVK